ncbi:hypothetical protein LCGC14_0422570 [marine sediment metagenome]|uniref:Uncharacterized protein n=1 Tax=marine sediment metagenome TaxID=412755 RepID=A0A0F9SWD2_9ZZZZ
MQIKPIYELLIEQHKQLQQFAQIVNDAVAVNSYMLLEVEAQLRGDKPKEEKQHV